MPQASARPSLKPVNGSVPVVVVPEGVVGVEPLEEPTEALEALGALDEVDGAELDDEGAEEALLPLEEEPLPEDDEPCELPELPEPFELEPLDPEPEPEPELEFPSGLTYCWSPAEESASDTAGTASRRAPSTPRQVRKWRHADMGGEYGKQ
jgi:hypothetical protein